MLSFLLAVMKHFDGRKRVEEVFVGKGDVQIVLSVEHFRDGLEVFHFGYVSEKRCAEYGAFGGNKYPRIALVNLS